MKKLILGVVLVNLLAACGSNPPKAAVADAKPAQAEPATVAATPAATVAATPAVAATPTESQSTAQTDANVKEAAAATAAAEAAAVQADANASAAEKARAAAVSEMAARAALEAQDKANVITASAATGNALESRSVYFPFDVDAVQAADLDTIQAQARNLSDNADMKTRVEGNADERGSSEYNLALGQRRANNTKKALVLGGARSDQIETVSFGEEKPRASGHDEASWAQNRRADIKVGE
jgi:peptidoglycan-associated lipoprotein